MRHGETDLNRDNRLQGQIDCPLNGTGIRQAKEAGEHLEGSRRIMWISTMSIV